jgi:transposase-like protein
MFMSDGRRGGFRRFSPQFKAEAVQMVVVTGRTVTEVARSLGVTPQGLGNWVRAYRVEHLVPGKPIDPLGVARIRQLEDENRRLVMENEFLKKAAAFFARTLP